MPLFMKSILLSISLLFCAVIVSAQNGLFFGHYMFNPTNINPAWVGSQQEAFAAVQFRSQWLGYSTSFDGTGGSPNSQMVTTIVPIRNFFFSSVGLNISNDMLGAGQTNLQIQLPFSYSRNFGESKLHIGLAPALLSQSIGTSQLRPNEPENFGSGEVQIKPNLSAGLFFESSKNWYLGLGVINLLEPGFQYGSLGIQNVESMSFALHWGTYKNLGNGFILNPNMVLRSNLDEFSFDIGGILTVDEKMWGGLAYRNGESIILYLGYNLLPEKTLKVGYSFDLIIQGREGKSATTHEIILKYRLPDLVFGGKKTVKTPRFIF